MDDKKKHQNQKFSDIPSCEVVDGQPEDCNEMVNHYGRCNVQKTSATDNDYPAIAQGLSPDTKQHVQKERDEWLHRNGKESGGKYKH